MFKVWLFINCKLTLNHFSSLTLPWNGKHLNFDMFLLLQLSIFYTLKHILRMYHFYWGFHLRESLVVVLWYVGKPFLGQHINHKNYKCHTTSLQGRLLKICGNRHNILIMISSNTFRFIILSYGKYYYLHISSFNV